jgi:RNA polymerase sigma-70 factor, ECF subfamily
VGDDDRGMASPAPSPPDHAGDLLAIYDRGVDEVYRFLRPRCGDRQLAEDLTADVFLAAVGQVQRQRVEEVTVAWLIGIARHKLVDHWRRVGRRPRVAGSIDDLDPPGDDGDEPWNAVLDRHQVRTAMDALGDHHRSALVLRYVDGLPVPEVAHHLGRTVHATEALLVRARRQFRATYERQHAGDPHPPDPERTDPSRGGAS